MAFLATMFLAASAGAQTWFGGESELETKSWNRDTFYFSVSGLLVAPQDADNESTEPLLNGILGGTNSTTEFDLSAGVSGAIGYDFADQFRAEIQYSYMDIQMSDLTAGAGTFNPSGTASTQTLMINAYYDFPFTVQLEPYVGAGVGIAFHQANLNSVNGLPTGLSRDNDTTLAYQAMAGVGYKVSPNMTLSAGARYVTGDDPDYGSFTTEFATLAFEFGLRVGF
jgi:opacity protein-like surface antigen